ncbi:enoyl-CoA hydratase [Bordetella genomosp. 7]|jgi:enoyl-CoA hydratase|uniref:Enoyl-CoA hydratase n=1 Tax=Bordetella genomosp. 7 TaxID=1416805 RepID=A0A261R077_9BORD|nr:MULTISPECIES: enoyl-CoA hydratase-related protein [Bordetella]OZI18010.1 enoyl-CoA hydratase [Bordetella genomosp. 7]OZI21803.1 enoyl-CoA hydratase [Bordetella genomosp. 7]
MNTNACTNAAGEPLVLVQRDDGIVTVVLNRPEKLNAFTIDGWRLLGDTFLELGADDSVRCIILRGAGEKAFSPGNDIGEFETSRSNKQQARIYGAVMRRTIEALQDCPHPIVAQIHGICVGGGLEIACLADIRICGASSRFGVPIKNLGLVMSYSELGPLVRLVGPSVALQVLLEGTIFDASEALRLGVVTRVASDDDVAAEAQATARRIAEGAPLVARWHKKFVGNLVSGKALADEDRDEAFDCFDTEDFRSGYRAFLSKEKPRFQGR